MHIIICHQSDMMRDMLERDLEEARMHVSHLNELRTRAIIHVHVSKWGLYLFCWARLQMFRSLMEAFCNIHSHRAADNINAEIIGTDLNSLSRGLY